MLSPELKKGCVFAAQSPEPGPPEIGSQYAVTELPRDIIEPNRLSGLAGSKAKENSEVIE